MRWLSLGFLCLVNVFCLTGCSQITHQEDDDLRTTPVTNNPNIIPQHGQSLIPGMPESPR
jgi:hypothetical protein